MSAVARSARSFSQLLRLPVVNMSSSAFSTAARYNNIPTSLDPAKKVQDKLLFTPGPLTTSYTVKQALTHDLGSRDVAFIRVIKEVRQGLLDVAGVSNKEYTTVPIQGSGTYGIEAVLSSAVDKKKGVFIIANGAYGMRQVSICKVQKIPYVLYEVPDNVYPDLNRIEEMLKNEAKDVSHVSVVHSETTSGIVNDIESIGQVVSKFNKSFIVDAMSSFGAYPIDFKKANLTYLVSSANKCIEGVPGFSFAIASIAHLEKECKDNATTLSLDLYAQRKGLDENGQFRFTPPTHPLLAFNVALKELQQEGGVAARARRYKENQRVLAEGLKPLGFELYLRPEVQGYIISSYHWPKDKNWNFEQFYSKLNERNFVIYPGKVSKADCFRIGHIGRIFPEDTQRLVDAIVDVCKEMKTASFYPK